MRGLFLTAALVLSAFFSNSQINFTEAYQQYSSVPKGLLEAVAYTQTRFQVIDNQTAASCSGIPLPYGIMGLVENGAGYFIENGELVAQLSGISIENQKTLPQQQVIAYAKAFELTFLQVMQSDATIPEAKAVYFTLMELTEIPDSGIVNQFARDLQAFEILRFMNNSEQAEQHDFPVHGYLLKDVFGSDNLKILSAEKVQFTPTGILNSSEVAYNTAHVKSTEYTPAIWNPAPICNFSSRSGTAVSAITIHTIQGTYAGAISWSQNCDANVSYHYVIRSSDGQVTQMVSEADKAWHVGSENPYTIGYEHEGYVDNPVWYTQAMYNNSAALSRDIITSGYGIPAVRTYYGAASASVQVLGGCTKIKGHQHYPSQSHTDPGINWNWEKYYQLINNNPTIVTITTNSGNFYDSGNSTGNYQDDERLLWLFQPANATSITLNFSAFNVESGYDKLFIYDGATLNSPLIGSYTGTNSPGSISSSGGALLVEFRSDCGTVAAGWEAVYSAASSDDQAPVSSIVNNSDWKTEDFIATFVDTDNIGVVGKYFQASDKDPLTGKWSANGNLGFCEEDFSTNTSNWTAITGSFVLNNGAYSFSDVTQQNSNSSYALQQNGSGSYLYEWNQNITSTEANQRAGLHFFCDDATLPNRGNSYFVYFRETEQKVQIYKVIADVFSPKTNDNCVVTANTNYTYKVTYDPQSGWIKVYSNDVLVTQWQDIEPLQSGNSISLRSGGCAVTFDNVRVYQSRGTTEQITVSPSGLFRYQSIAADPTGKIRSLSNDEIGNWSSAAQEFFKIDWTTPGLSFLHDGTDLDIDTTFTSEIAANWLGEDEHSSIDHYEVAIGILPSLTNILDWTNVDLDEIYTHILANPIYETVYHVSLRIENGAGLTGLFVSNGQRLVDEAALSNLELPLSQIQIYPNPATDNFTIDGITEEIEILVYDMHGKLILREFVSEQFVVPTASWSKGSYQVIARKNQSFILKKLILQN